MLTAEMIGRIRRERFLKGKSIKKIARDAADVLGRTAPGVINQPRTGRC